MISFISAFHEAHELQEDVLHQVAHLMDRQGLSSAAPSGEMRLQSAHEDARVIVQRLGADGLSSAAKRNRGGLALPSSLTDGLHTVSVGGESFRVLVRTTAAGGEDRSRPIVRLSQRNRP